MNIIKKTFFALNILFAFLFSASVAESIIPQPFRIGGTVTVDGSQLNQASDSGYTFIVTEQDGNDFSPEALDTDGLNGSNWYIIDIPIYDATDQQGGANPGDNAVIHVYRNGEELIVTSPANGSITVGGAGSTQRIDLTVESPYIPPTQYQLTASVSGGNGTVSPTSGTYDEGTLVTLTARPNTGYRVASWSGTNNDGSDSNTNTVTMSSNKTVTVSFEEISPSKSYQLVTAVQGGGGTILPTSGTYDEGTVVKLIASPNSGYHVALWSGTDNDHLTSEINFVTMDSSKTVMVMFNESEPVIESFTVIPSIINQGEVTYLSWNITGADSANIDNGVGHVGKPSGSINISPDTTTIYTLTATNSWGSVSASVSVTVREKPIEEDGDDGEGSDSEDTDTDNDGLPDIWEEAYGMDPMDAMGVNGKNGDFDGDGWSNYEEYENETNPADSASVPLFDKIRILETIPHHGAGDNDDSRVANNTSFSVRIEALSGIDVTNPGSVRFTIMDDGLFDYTRDLGDTELVRVINLSGEPDTNVKELWVSYYRSAESRSYPSKAYTYDTPITIKVDIEDREGVQMKQAVFRLRIETEEEHDAAQEPADLLEISAVDPEDPDLEGEYDAGIQVDSGDLAGAKIIYNSDEPLMPTLDLSNELPPVDVEDLNGVGMPLVLQPHAVFSTPVKIFIPCPEYPDLRELCVMFHNGDEWVAACDESGDILPGGEGWMVPGSRVNRDDDEPATIEIQVYHFSAVQAATDRTVDSIPEDEEEALEEIAHATAGGGGGGGCFIGTASASVSKK